MRAVLIAAVVSLVIALFGTPLFIRFLVRKGYGQFIRDDGPTSHHTKRGTPDDGRRGHHRRLAGGLRRRRTWSPCTPPTVSGLLVLFLMTGLGLVGFLDDFIKISKQRSLGLRTRREAGRADAGRRRSSRSSRCSSPTARSARRPRPSISFVRDTPSTWPSPGAARRGHPLRHLGEHHRSRARRNGVNLTDGLDGLATGASRDGVRRVRADRHLAVQPELPVRTRAPSATRCATRTTSRSSPPAAWVPASASCGGTPRRPRSSWATPARWPSAARWPGWPSSPAPSCSSSSSVACSSSITLSVIIQVGSLQD